MSRQYLIPGWGYANEITTRQFLIPGQGYINTTQPVTAVGSSTGSSVATGVGSALNAGAGSSAASASASSNGTALGTGVGSGSGAATVSGTAPSGQGIAASTGTGTALAIGLSTAASPASASGTASPAAIGAYAQSAAGQAAGSALAQAVGLVPAQISSYLIPGWGAVNENLPRQFLVPGWGYLSDTRIGGNSASAQGISSAQAVGAYSTAAPGLASASGTSTAAANGAFANLATAAGLSTAQANSSASIAATASSPGVAIGSFVGASSFFSAVFYANMDDLFNYINIQSGPSTAVSGTGLSISTSFVNGASNLFMPTVGSVAGSSSVAGSGNADIAGTGVAIGISGVSGDGAVAVALPPLSTASGKSFSGARIDTANISTPVGDWSIGGWFRLEANAFLGSGYLFHLYTSTGGTKAYAWYDKGTGRIYFGGTDDSGVALGAHSFNIFGNTQISVLSSHLIPAGTDVYVVCQKVGNKAQIWLKFNGHAPVLAAEEITLFGLCAAQTLRFGRGYNDTGPLDAKMRNWFKLSYSLTKDQIDKAANGDVDPTTLASYAADDFYFPMNDVSNTRLASSINGILTTATGGGMHAITNLGYAPMSEAIFLDPLGADGFVIQQVGGQASVGISGTYQGTHGADIQVQAISDMGALISSWQTVMSAATGNVWSGSITLPKGKRWIMLQMRKVISGTPSTQVMTSTLRWGIGENFVLSGQSLMYYLGQTGFPYGSTGLALNGYSSFMSVLSPIQGGVLTNSLTITGAASNGGLIEITTQNAHGLMAGEKVAIASILGTTEANNAVWTITPTSTTKFTLNGSTFVNAYVSGGVVQVGKHVRTVPNQAYQTTADGHTIAANAISETTGSVVCLINNSVAGTSIASHYGWGSIPRDSVLAGHAAGRIGGFAWCQGQNDQGDSPLRQYYADGGVSGAWTGYGLLGNLYNFYTANWPNADFQFGVVPYHSNSGVQQVSPQSIHDFRFGMTDWCIRKAASGNPNVYAPSWQHDFEAQYESNVVAHLEPMFKGTKSMAARIGHDYATRVNGTGNDSYGPKITAASRTGATIDLTIAHNGGTALKTLTNGAVPSGFEVSASNSFSSLLTISNVAIINATTVRITLSADPGATCYVRYMFGYSGNFAAFSHFCPLVTGVADNGAGLIRITTATSPAGATIPSGAQRTGGHGLTTGQWIRMEGVRGAIRANGDWQVTVIDSQNFDLLGSSSAGMGTYAVGNLWQTNASAVVSVTVAVPIYDNRTIGGIDTNGAPLQPTFTYLTA